MSKIYNYNHIFTLESGQSLPSLDIAYDTWGTLAPARDNVVWVCHALTANSDVADWWPGTVEPNRFLDPEQYYIVCANILGSCYGTTGPSSINPATGQPWWGSFPRVTMRDMVRAHRLLARHLGIDHVQLLVGSSIGGFQCLEWCISEPQFARNAAFIATAAQASPWQVAFNETQRMAIDCDSTFGSPSAQAGMTGMAVARTIALLSYRGGKAYNKTQADTSLAATCFDHRVQSYQHHQGEKLCRRFNAYSYYRLLQAFDSHDVGRGRGGVARALQCIKARTLVVAITSDILFPVEEHEVLTRNIPDVHMEVIDSDFGHDGFLVENEQLNAIIQRFLNNKQQ